MSGIRLIVGLGNPGTQYAATRHNVGAWFVDIFAEQENISLRLEKQFRGYVGEITVSSDRSASASDHAVRAATKCFLFKPTTYMNESGMAVVAITQFYKILPEEILLVHDELDFDVGVARLKQAGGHGGHNGLRNIIAHLSSSDFYRLRLGIGHPGSRDEVTNYVLGNPSRDDRVEIIKAIDESFRVMPDLFDGKIQQAFHTLHSD
ncbi:MAG: aminoacyl-tRNA hydrolase [Gammaproteobacteria bacterium RIFCSPHIGHO2_12_FULL_40_19]|nr:MAG: aminoacyl-tRNA hydrolase [Gammaproteobacteria bacterium RIFCSPHIGHO2_12_FULL_40_19]